MSKNLLIKCNEATSICDKKQYNEASFFDKIRLSIHNFLCHRCKLYSHQNKIMTQLLRTYKENPAPKTLDAKDKNALQKALNKKRQVLDTVE